AFGPINPSHIVRRGKSHPGRKNSHVVFVPERCLFLTRRPVGSRTGGFSSQNSVVFCFTRVFFENTRALRRKTRAFQPDTRRVQRNTRASKRPRACFFQIHAWSFSGRARFGRARARSCRLARG